MAALSFPLSRLIHENLSVLMCFVYSRKPLEEVAQSTFQGEWKYLNKALFDISVERAEKACVELALFLRMLDDDENLTGYHTGTRNVPDCGRLIMKDGVDKMLTFREAANKIIHADRLEWNLSRDPHIVCHARQVDTDRWGWIRAEVDIVAIAFVCGQLMS